MVLLVDSLSKWKSEDFEKTLKTELECLTGKELPLQAGLQYSGYALDDNIKTTILRSDEDDRVITIIAGVFYTGIIAGCSCSDDPSPTDVLTEYCEITVSIDKQTAEADILLRNQ